MGLIHSVFGVAALILGTCVVFARKGTAVHKYAGRCFAVTMLLLNATGLLIYRLTGLFGPFHVAAIISLLTVCGGLWHAWRRRPGWILPHAIFMSWAYCGLLAATAAEIAGRIPGWSFFWSVLLSSLLVIFAGGVMINRRVRGIVNEYSNQRDMV